MLSSVNGELSSSLSVLDRGLAYGDGVFETMRLLGRDLPLWRYHRQRLLEGCERLQIALDKSHLKKFVKAFVAEAGHRLDSRPGVVKLIVTRGEGGRGYGFDASLKPNVILQLYPTIESAAVPLELDVCAHRLPFNPPLAGIKHLNRLDNVLLKTECQMRGAEDGLVLDNRDRVVETTSSNLFFETAGRLQTPPLEECGVAGVMRRFIMEELAPSLGIAVDIARIEKHSLGDFDAVFCCNSVLGLRPVIRAGEFFYEVSPLFCRLQNQLMETRFAKAR